MAIRGTEGRTREKDGVMGKEEGKEEDFMEQKAKGVSEAAVKRYWREREGERKAARGSLLLLSVAAFFTHTHTHTHIHIYTHFISLNHICTHPPPFFFFLFFLDTSPISRKSSSTPIISPCE